MSKKPFGAPTIYVILGLVFIALIGIRTISTPEIWTHLAQGRTNAPISYLEAAESVNTTHLYDKVVYGLWNLGGAPVLIIFNVICLLATFILLLQVSRKWGGELSQGFALLISGQLIFQSVDVSPQTMMMLFIALFVYLFSTIKKTSLLFAILIPLQILWTNTHGSFLFGPFIALLAAIQAGQRTKGVNRKTQQALQPAPLAGLTVALLAVTLINPYFARLHTQVFANIAMPYPTYWSSLFREYFQTPARDPLIFLVLILGAGGLITLKKSLPVMLTTLAIIGSFFVIRSMQTAQLFAVLAFPFIVLSFTAVGESLSGSFKTLLGKQERFLLPATRGILVLLFILSIIPIVSNCAYVEYGSASNFGLGVQEELYPSGAEAIIDHPAFPAKALNLAADGGYLAWKFNRKVFIDYRPGRYDRELLENLNAMMLGSAKAYDAIYVANRPEAIIINTLSPSSAQGIVTLLSRRIWKLAYFDGTTAILLLNKEEFAPILNDKAMQAAGLAKLEVARATYAAKLEKGCRAGNPAELIGSGKIFLALNRPAESKAIFALLLQGNNKIPGAWIGLGNSQLLLREFDAAVETLNKATQLAPNNIFAWASYATACRYAGKPDEQQKAMEKVKHLAEQNKVEEPEVPEPQPNPEAAEPTNKSLQNITIPE
jgi:tetratricopeptide (TPR) repeat protein